MPLHLNAVIDRPLVPGDATSERHLLLTVQAPEATVQRLPLNLALVLDASGSMEGEKLERAKEAACALIEHLRNSDRVAIVAYDDQVSVVVPSTRLTAELRPTLQARIRAIQADATTNLSGGWLTGCQEVANAMTAEEAHHRVILLTDGLANEGITDLKELIEHARQLRQRGIVTSTMGLGADFNEELLEALARHGGGRFQYIQSAKHLRDCVQGELGELQTIAVRGLSLHVELPSGVRFKHCLNEHLVERAGRSLHIALGDLLSGHSLGATLALTVEPHRIVSRELLTIHAQVRFTDMASSERQQLTLPPVSLQFADANAVRSQRSDAQVEAEVDLLRVTQAKTEAIVRSRQGDHAGASQLLRTASQVLGASPAAAMPAARAEIAALQEMADQAEHGLSEDQHKELHYQAYLKRSARQRYDQTTQES